MKTFVPKVNLDQRKWHIVDANGAVLGRLAVQIADILRGKNNPAFTPHLDTGEHFRTVAEMRAQHPEKLIMHAVHGMIPKNRLGRRLLTKLKVYKGNGHLDRTGKFKHVAQQPAPLQAAQ